MGLPASPLLLAQLHLTTMSRTGVLNWRCCALACKVSSIPACLLLCGCGCCTMVSWALFLMAQAEHRPNHPRQQAGWIPHMIWPGQHCTICCGKAQRLDSAWLS